MAIIRRATGNKMQQNDAQHKTIACNSRFCIFKKHVRSVKIQRRASKRRDSCFTRNQRETIQFGQKIVGESMNVAYKNTQAGLQMNKELLFTKPHSMRTRRHLMKLADWFKTGKTKYFFTQQVMNIRNLLPSKQTVSPGSKKDKTDSQTTGP